MGLGNDERGWVMTSLSGVACVLGAAVICVDILIRQLPHKRHFRIQDSNAFLSASLSLSFGVMLFSSLFNMLPSSKQSLRKGGYSPKEASWIMIASFIGGAIGIQLISRVLHRFIPSHVVDCEHTHSDGDDKEEPTSSKTKSNSQLQQHRNHDQTLNEDLESHTRPHSDMRDSHRGKPSNINAEDEQSSRKSQTNPRSLPQVAPEDHLSIPDIRTNGRPSLGKRFTSTLSQLTTRSKPSCGNDCYGFTPPCSSECFQNVNARGGYRAGAAARPLTSRSVPLQPASETTPLLRDVPEDDGRPHYQEDDHDHAHSHDHSHECSPKRQTRDMDLSAQSSVTCAVVENEHVDSDEPHEDPSSPDHHHHHVPSNEFLSIGLQTSIAIAIHKLPEGFITYATNHANPKLGISVFLALFIHNITEGFAMALPLYLALQSRIKAMLISFVLGGLTQPLGAGIAALWFKIAGKGEWAPSEAVYGGMFAVTAGIMASVALQLFGEALDLTHSRGLCMIGAFTGMTIMGISSALTA